METLCPHCDTRYQIEREALVAANGLVRCSLCHNVFNALKHLRRSPGEQESLPEIEEEVETQTETNPSLPSMIPDGTRAEIESEQFAPPEPDEGIFDIEDALTAPRRRRMRKALSVFVGLLLAIVLAAQLAWFERDKLLSQSRSRDIIERACDLLNCTPPEWRDPSKFEILQRSLVPKPGQPGVLVLEGQFINQAEVPQPLPILQLTFLDGNEKLLARRRLQPGEYLASPTLDGQLAAPKEVFTIDLALVDPGPQATGFELAFY